MTLQLKNALFVILIAAFSCTQVHKNVEVANVNAKPAVKNTMAVGMLEDTVVHKQNKNIAGKPACCRNIPSRFKAKLKQ